MVFIENKNTSVSDLKPHHRLYVLLSILALVFVVGSIFMYKNKTKDYITTNSDNKILTEAERMMAISKELNNSTINTSPPTPEELKKIADILNKENKSERQPTPEELGKIAESLNKK